MMLTLQGTFQVLHLAFQALGIWHSRLAFQGMLDHIKTMQQVAHLSYKYLETFDFNTR